MTFCHRRCTVVPSFPLENRVLPGRGRDVPRNTLLSQKNQILCEFLCFALIVSVHHMRGTTYDATQRNTAFKVVNPISDL